MTESSILYKRLFNPRSIVVIGASNDPLKPGGRVTANIKNHGYKGKLWAVNPKTPSVMDLPTFSSLDILPEVPELAYIAIPASFVRAAIEDLARIGNKAVIILTAGFGEKDQAGKEEEKKFLEIAAENGITLIGPNCSGFLTTSYAGKFTGYIPKLKEGAIDIISGSGATVDYLIEQATMRGLSFGNVVNMGNSIQMGVEDILALVDENYGPADSRLILLYMESLKKPMKLLEHARNLTEKGYTLAGIKSGVTDVGERAAASHTGAMATPDVAVQALFDKAGIIRVASKADLIDVACAFTALRGLIHDYRVCILTDAGGPGVMLSDELSRQGLKVPLMSEKTRERLSEVLPSESSISNPIDCLPSRTPEQFSSIFKTLEEEEKGNIDLITVITGNSGLTDNWELYKAIIEGMENCSIPIIPVLSSVNTCEDLIRKVREGGKVIFTDEVLIGRALGKLSRKPEIDNSIPKIKGYNKKKIETTLKKQGEHLTPDAVKKILSAAGFRFPYQNDVFKKEDLKITCKEGAFPLVMKVIGPLHKSDVGGVRVGIESHEEAESAWDDLLKIDGAEGVLIQQQVKGTEVIIGAKKEEGFGHLIMFGLGGVYTEVLKDVRFALAPLGNNEAMNMITGIKALPIIKGIRGEKGVSLELLAEYLVRLGVLVNDFPQIEEIDLNPIKGFESDLYVVDARIIQNKYPTQCPLR